MTVQPFTNEQLNYFKFASIVLNEFVIALRQTFKSMWDNIFGHRHGYQPWDNSTVVRNLFLAEEGGKSKVPTHTSYEEWDCTALFQATIYAKSFATPDSKGDKRKLYELYVKHHKVPLGKFHSSVVSPSGNIAETFALAIDQLRLLRNSLCHSDKSEIDKPTFDQYVQLAKEAFKALGIKEDPIDAIGGLTESDFPTKEVRRLEESLKQETRSYIECLEEVRSSVQCLEEVKSGVDKLIAQGNAMVKVEDLALLERKIDDLKLKIDHDQTDSKPFLPPSNLPSKVPHFTGRQRECEGISSHLTYKSSRIVSIWGSPGFGKTSVATEVGHQLQTEGLPVYFFSMRGLLSKADLTSQLISFFRRHYTKDQIPQQMSIEDELSLFLSEISGEFVMILDNADEFLESGAPNVKEDFINLLEVILRQVKNLTFLLTTRESLEFMNVHFEGHQAVRIGSLHESFSQTLVGGLLPKATASDCSNIATICGFVPLAMKMLCSSIAEDNAQPTQFLDSFKESIESNLLELLDNPDYPSNLRLKLLFESSFQRLSISEKEALVSLSVLSGDFNHSVAAAVMGVKTTLEAKKILHTLRRKSFLDSASSKPESFSMHKLILSFTRETGENDMKETMLNSKVRLSAFYVSLFEKLNQQFWTGQSMQAFIDFYEEKQNIIQSLMESCSDPKTCDVAFGVLTKAEIFLDSLFWCEGKVFEKIYEHATEKAQAFGKSVFYNQLLVSLAFGEVTWGIHGRSMTLLSKADSLSLSVDDKRKLLCYKGLCQLVSGKIDEGAENLQEALYLMSDSPEQRILRVTTLQILVTYFLFKEKKATSLELYTTALHECRALGDTSLLVIPPVNNKESRMIEADMSETDVTTTQPLRLQMICVVSTATEMFSDYETKQAMSKSVLRMSNQSEKWILPHSIGSWTFQCNVNWILCSVLNNPKEASELCDTWINYHKMTLKQSGKVVTGDEAKPNEDLDLNLYQERLFRNYMDKGHAIHKMQNYCGAIQSFQSALEIARGLFGEERPDIAECYFYLGQAQDASDDISSALQSFQRALDIRVKLFGEKHPDTAQSYFSLGKTQYASGDLSSAVHSFQCALEIRIKLFGEEHPNTTECYFFLKETQRLVSSSVSSTCFD